MVIQIYIESLELLLGFAIAAYASTYTSVHVLVSISCLEWVQ